MVPLVVYFAGSLFGRLVARWCWRGSFSIQVNLFLVWAPKNVSIVTICGVMSGKISSLYFILCPPLDVLEKFQAFFGFQMRSLVQSDWSQFHWISLFWKGPSLPNIFDLPFKVFPSSNNKSFRWEWFTYCTEFSSSVVREISHGSPISVRGPLQRRDRVEKVCLPCFGQRKMNIWKEHLSCG